MEIKFCGAARTVTGSSHLLTLDDGYKILLDCGLYQGREEDMEGFNQEWMFEPAEVDAVVLSHSHIDHCGRLPKLVKDGFKGKIYTTHASRDLCAIMLMDSASIQMRDAEWINKRRKLKGEERVEALYDRIDTKKCLNRFVAIGYKQWQTIHPDVQVMFRDSGHILGSANVTLKIKRGGMRDTYFGFSGDIGRPNRPILRDPEPIQPCDYLICESTYGNKLHSAAPQEEDRLLNIIRETCVKKRGKLIIPAFSVGRTQEIVHLIDRLENAGELPGDLPVYVDSPLAIDATEIFRMHPDCFDDEMQEYMWDDPNPFGFKNLKYTKTVEQSKALNHKDACIIISASGMITAGRIRHHVYNNIGDARNTILIVGYCAPYTIGAQLASGREVIKIFGEEKKVKASIEVMNSFSAHGDQQEMIDFLEKQDRKRLRKVFLVHGDYKRQEGFKGALEKAGFDNIEIPDLGDSFRL